MNKLIFLVIYLFSSNVHACLCSEELALKNGVLAILQISPSQSSELDNYQLVDVNNSYRVTLKKSTDNPYQRGGGLAEAVIHKESCEVINVYYAR